MNPANRVTIPLCNLLNFFCTDCRFVNLETWSASNGRNLSIVTSADSTIIEPGALPSTPGKQSGWLQLSHCHDRRLLRIRPVRIIQLTSWSKVAISRLTSRLSNWIFSTTLVSSFSHITLRSSSIHAVKSLIEFLEHMVSQERIHLECLGQDAVLLGRCQYIFIAAMAYGCKSISSGSYGDQYGRRNSLNWDAVRQKVVD